MEFTPLLLIIIYLVLCVICYLDTAQGMKNYLEAKTKHWSEYEYKETILDKFFNWAGKLWSGLYSPLKFWLFLYPWQRIINKNRLTVRNIGYVRLHLHSKVSAHQHDCMHGDNRFMHILHFGLWWFEVKIGKLSS